MIFQTTKFGFRWNHPLRREITIRCIKKSLGSATGYASMMWLCLSALGFAGGYASAPITVLVVAGSIASVFFLGLIETKPEGISDFDMLADKLSIQLNVSMASLLQLDWTELRLVAEITLVELAQAVKLTEKSALEAGAIMPYEETRWNLYKEGRKRRFEGCYYFLERHELASNGFGKYFKA